MLAAAVLLAACASDTSKKAAEPEIPATPTRIIMFYASPPAVAPGDSALLCYGVEGATEVKLDPEVEPLSPSLSRCIEVRPQQTTKYTLHVGNKDGGHDMKSLEVAVDPRAKRVPATPAPAQQGLILFFASSAASVPKGGPVTLCYGVKGASSVRIEPNVRALEAVEKSCFAVPKLDETTKFTLLAEGPGGAADRETVTVTVR